MSSLSRWLTASDVLLELPLTTKTAVFEQVARHLSPRLAVPARQISQQLQQREALGSTAVGQGMAIPHARLSGLTQPVLVFVRPELPLEFEAPDAKPVSDLLVVLVPAQASSLHLELLAEIAQRFNHREFRTALRDCTEAEEVVELFARPVPAR